ncbi:MAG: hypothetical protein RL446_541 [Pseudomonadota bacterium]|jgi:preprotein translocase subunit SecE
MNTATDVSSAWPDRLLLLASAAAFLAGVVGFHWAADRALLGLGLLFVGLAGAVVLGLVSPSGRRFVAFAKEASHEAKRVHWPTRKETLQATGIVFVFVFVMALFLWLTDKSLEWVLYDLLLGWK